MNLQELKAELTRLQHAYKALYESFPIVAGVKTASGLPSRDVPANKVEELRKMHADMTAIGAKIEDQEGFADMAHQIEESGRPVNRPTRAHADRNGNLVTAPRLSIGERFAQHDNFAEARTPGAPRGQGGTLQAAVNFEDIHLRTLLQTSTGYPPESLRNGDVVEIGSMTPTVLDMIPMRPSSENAVVYMRQTTRTNNAAPVAEGSAAAESALAWTEITAPHIQIATFIPATQQQLEDVAGLPSLIDQELMLMLRQDVETEIMTGDGTGQHMTGFENLSGILTQAQSTDTLLDCYLKAMVKCGVSGYVNPSGFVMHPTAWQNIQLQKTADGIYLFGNPAQLAAPRLWGLPVCTSLASTLTTPIVGDFKGYSYLSNRVGIEIGVSSDYSDYFVKWIQVIRARLRAVLVNRRSTAFVKIALN